MPSTQWSLLTRTRNHIDIHRFDAHRRNTCFGSNGAYAGNNGGTRSPHRIRRPTFGVASVSLNFIRLIFALLVLFVGLAILLRKVFGLDFFDRWDDGDLNFGAVFAVALSLWNGFR